MPAILEPIPVAALRQALGEFATGVTVVTACGLDGRPVGLTVNSFASVSLAPPLVLWSLELDSPSLNVFEQCSHYAVNVLAADQMDMSQRFSQTQSDKFSGLEWQTGLGGTALLPGCCAWFECRNEIRHAGGDHLILIGRVERFARNGGEPLIFHGSRYRMLGDG
jgi:flavin reductase (DIM6/NTAB) family NADH-FMN oxidoreductase RutF